MGLAHEQRAEEQNRMHARLSKHVTHGIVAHVGRLCHPHHRRPCFSKPEANIPMCRTWNPSTRWTPQQALQHPFITQQRFTGPFQPQPAQQEARAAHA